MQKAVIAFGSNLQNPVEQVQRAIKTVALLPEILNLKASSLYRSKAVGHTNQPDFINAVAVVETEYTAAELLVQLQKIENNFGRERSFPNAPRTLDLDIIDFNHIVNQHPDLQLPHPRAHLRHFVMRPLAEIAPDYSIGQFGTAAALAEQLGSQGIEKLA